MGWFLSGDREAVEQIEGNSNPSLQRPTVSSREWREGTKVGRVSNELSGEGC